MNFFITHPVVFLHIPWLQAFLVYIGMYKSISNCIIHFEGVPSGGYLWPRTSNVCQVGIASLQRLLSLLLQLMTQHYVNVYKPLEWDHLLFERVVRLGIKEVLNLNRNVQQFCFWLEAKQDMQHWSQHIGPCHFFCIEALHLDRSINNP